jgi:hypothetical protein
MSLTCPILNDIILEEINNIKQSIITIKSNDTTNLNKDLCIIDKYIDSKYEKQEKELEKLKKMLELEHLDNALLNEKIDKIANSISNNNELNSRIDNLEKKNITINSKLDNILENNKLYELKIVELVNNKINEVNSKIRTKATGTVESGIIDFTALKGVVNNLASTIVQINAGIKKINNNISDLTYKVNNLEYKKRSFNNKKFTKTYNKSNKLYDDPVNNEPLDDGWTKVANKKKNKNN